MDIPKRTSCRVSRRKVEREMQGVSLYGVTMEMDEWLSLSEAAKLLGVHPSTVRLWSDKGVLPTHRTSGGHRRYRRQEMLLWAKTAREVRAEPESIMHTAMTNVRMQIGEAHLESEGWYQKLDENARRQYR